MADGDNEFSNYDVGSDPTGNLGSDIGTVRPTPAPELTHPVISGVEGGHEPTVYGPPVPATQPAPAEPQVQPPPRTLVDDLLDKYSEPDVINTHPEIADIEGAGQNPSWYKDRKFRGDASTWDYAKRAGDAFERRLIEEYPDKAEQIKKARPLFEKEIQGRVKQHTLQKLVDEYKHGLTPTGDRTDSMWSEERALSHTPFLGPYLYNPIKDRIDKEAADAVLKSGNATDAAYEQFARRIASDQIEKERSTGDQVVGSLQDMWRMGSEYALMAETGAPAAGGSAGANLMTKALGETAAKGILGRAAVWGAKQAATGVTYTAMQAPLGLTEDIIAGKSPKEMGDRIVDNFFDNVAFGSVGGIGEATGAAAKRGIASALGQSAKEALKGTAKMLVGGELSQDAKYAIGHSEHAGPLTALIDPRSTEGERARATHELMVNGAGIFGFEALKQMLGGGGRLDTSLSKTADAMIGNELARQEAANAVKEAASGTPPKLTVAEGLRFAELVRKGVPPTQAREKVVSARPEPEPPAAPEEEGGSEPPEPPPPPPKSGKEILSDIDTPAARTLMTHPKIEDIAAHVPPGSEHVGSGGSSVVLKTPAGDVVRIGLKIPRANIPEVLQPTSRDVISTHAVERLPFVDTKGMGEAELKEMDAKLAARGYTFADRDASNLGRTFDGQLVVTDAGAVRPMTAVEKMRAKQAPAPSEEKGKQYAAAGGAQALLEKAAVQASALRERLAKREEEVPPGQPAPEPEAQGSDWRKNVVRLHATGYLKAMGDTFAHPSVENLSRAADVLQRLHDMAHSRGLDPAKMIEEEMPEFKSLIDKNGEVLNHWANHPEEIPHSQEVKDAVNRAGTVAQRWGLDPASVRRAIAGRLQVAHEAARRAAAAAVAAPGEGGPAEGLPEVRGGAGGATPGAAGAVAGGGEAGGNVVNPLPPSLQGDLRRLVESGDRVSMADAKEFLKRHYSDAEIKNILKDAGKFPEGVESNIKGSALRGHARQAEGGYRKWALEQHFLAEIAKHEQGQVGPTSTGAAQEALHGGQADGVSQANAEAGIKPVRAEAPDIRPGEASPGAAPSQVEPGVAFRREPGAGEPTGASLTKAITDFAKGDQGAMDLGRVGQWIADKFKGTKDRVAKEAADVSDSVKIAFAPATRGEQAKKGAGVMRQNLAVMARQKEVAQQAMLASERYFEKNIERAPDPATRTARFLEFTDGFEKGDYSKLPKEIQEFAKTARELLDARGKQLADRDLIQPTIDNYMSHLWQKPNSQLPPEVIGGILSSKRPMAGKEGFRRQRSLEFYRDGIEAGLEPVSYNPATLITHSLVQMDKSIMAHDVREELKASGLRQFVGLGQEPPKGWVRGNDPADTVMQRQGAEQGGPILRGHHYYPEPVAMIINNYLQPGLRGNKAYDIIREFGNNLNQFQLGFGAFHAGFVALDTQISAAALGLQQASQGQFLKGAGNLALSAVPLGPGIKALISGSKVMREYYSPGSQGGETAELVKSLEEAGGRARMDNFYKSDHIERFRQAINDIRQGKGGFGSALYNAFPALGDAISKPIMESLVPRMKLGVFADMARSEMDRLERSGQALDTAARRDVLGKAWDSVENRLGQMTYDNLFWNKTGKDLAMIAIRSVGWNLGTVRELGGGIKDIPSSVMGTLKGQGISSRLAYTVALPMVTAFYGGIMHYLMTGRPPDELKDYFSPKTGRTNKDGSPERLSMPSYMNDVQHATNRADEGPMRVVQNLGQMAKSKLNPLIGLVSDMVFNEDFHDGAIRNPNDPAVKQTMDTAKHFIASFEPFSTRAFSDQTAKGAPLGQRLAGLVGFKPATANVTHTWEQQRQQETGKKVQLTPQEKLRRARKP